MNHIITWIFNYWESMSHKLALLTQRIKEGLRNHCNGIYSWPRIDNSIPQLRACYNKFRVCHLIGGWMSCLLMSDSCDILRLGNGLILSKERENEWGDFIVTHWKWDWLVCSMFLSVFPWFCSADVPLPFTDSATASNKAFSFFFKKKYILQQFLWNSSSIWIRRLYGQEALVTIFICDYRECNPAFRYPF